MCAFISLIEETVKGLHFIFCEKSNCFSRLDELVFCGILSEIIDSLVFRPSRICSMKFLEFVCGYFFFIKIDEACPRKHVRCSIEFILNASQTLSEQLVLF